MRRRSRWILLVAASVGVLAAWSFSDARGFRRYLELNTELRSIGDRNSTLRAQNVVLLREVQELKASPRALERAAREDLGFIKPGEIILNVE